MPSATRNTNAYSGSPGSTPGNWKIRSLTTIETPSAARKLTHDELVLDLRSFALERERFEDVIARRHGISPADLRALDHLSLHDGLTPGQLGERMMLSSGAVTALADRLEQFGWLTRERHPSDRRSTLLKLTAKALEAAEEIFGPYAGGLNAAAAALSDRERAACRAFLRHAAEISERHAHRQASAKPTGTASG